ncbi:MAG: PhnD/SsuA/transferrin family substrate-binding protein [Nitrospinota bacterium]
MKRYAVRRLKAAIALIAVFPLLILAFSLREASAEPVKIRLAHGIPPGHLTPLIFENKKLLKHHGKSYEVELIYVANTSAQIPMLAAKELDIAWIAYSSFATAIENAQLDIKAILDISSYGEPGHFTSYWSVMKDSPIKTIQDIKGKRIAVPAFGTALDIAARIALRKAGLEAKRDYTPVEVNFPNMFAMLSQGKVDIAAITTPFIFDPKISSQVRKVFGADEAMGKIQALFHAVRGDFLAKNRAAVQNMAEDYARGVQWFLNPANRDQALDVIAKFTKRPRSAYDAWALTKEGDSYHSPYGQVDVKVLQSNVNVLHEMGYLKKPLDIAKHVDASIAEEARRRVMAAAN